MNRRSALLSLFAIATSFAGVRVGRAAALPPVMAYRNPGCGCCEKWAERMKQAGFSVTIADDPALDARRSALGVPAELASCHTALIGDYVIEGHVPPEDILSLLDKRPLARGLAMPGMPMGSPGMDTDGAADRYDTLLMAPDGTWSVYASR
jgi:hypothetical protein